MRLLLTGSGIETQLLCIFLFQRADRRRSTYYYYYDEDRYMYYLQSTCYVRGESQQCAVPAIRKEPIIEFSRIPLVVCKNSLASTMRARRTVVDLERKRWRAHSSTKPRRRSSSSQYINCSSDELNCTNHHSSREWRNDSTTAVPREQNFAEAQSWVMDRPCPLDH